MKKKNILVVILCVSVLLLSCTACTSSDNTTVSNDGSSTIDPEESSGAIEEQITWLDYLPSPTANVIGIHYLDYIPEQESGGGYYSPYLQVKEPSEKTVGFVVDTMCPYCKTENGYRLEFKDIEMEKLGQPSVLFEQEMSCSNWANHIDPFTESYSASVLLTLSK